MDILGIHFAEAHYLLAAPLFLLGIIIMWHMAYKTYAKIKTFIHPSNHSFLLSHFSKKKMYLKTALLSIALLSIFFMLLRPQWGRKDEKIQQEGRDVLIVLDVSRSMLAHDLKPSRLEFAKLKIRNLYILNYYSRKLAFKYFEM